MFNVVLILKTQCNVVREGQHRTEKTLCNVVPEASHNIVQEKIRVMLSEQYLITPFI